MTGVSRFWSTNGTGDGTSGGYTQADFGRYLASSLITNTATEGVLFGVLNNLVVSASGANATIGTGAAVVYDKFYYNSSSFNLAIDPELTTRTDGVVLRYDPTAQTVRAVVKKNDVTVTQTAGGSGVWEILIATVSVVSGSATGATDARSYCKSPAAYGWFRSALTLSSTLTVSSNATVNGVLSSSSANVNGAFAASSATVNGNLNVTGTTTIATLSGTGIVGATNLATDSVTTVKIAASNVTSAKIADGAIVEAKIASAAVTSAKIGTGAVLTTNIGDSQVTSAKIADANVTTAKLNANAVVTTSITDLNVTTAKIAASAVTSAKIGASAVQTANIADYAVESLKIDTSAVTTAKIADVNVTEAKIASSAVTSGKIASGAVTLGKLATNSIDEDNIKADVVTGAKIGEWAVKFGGRQGGNSDNWATPGTSEYKNPISATYGSEVLMCSGSIQISISAAASGTANVTFYDKDTGSAPFATNPIMVIANNGSPDYIIDISAISTSGGTVRATHKAGTSATTTVTVWWIAIGTTTI
jgi:hypothetical protein